MCSAGALWSLYLEMWREGRSFSLQVLRALREGEGSEGGRAACWDVDGALVCSALDPRSTFPHDPLGP